MKFDDGFGEIEPVEATANDGFGEIEPVEQPEKQSLGILGTLKAQTDAKAGRETGTVEAVAENLPVVGQVMDAEYNRQWHVIKRLYEGDFRDTLEATTLAQSIHLPDEDIQRINEESGVGRKPYFGGAKTADAASKSAA